MKFLAGAIIILCVGIVADDALLSAKFTKAGHTTDSLDEVKALVKEKKAVLIDVREIYEWDEGHLSDAKFVPLSCVRDDKLTPDMKKNLPKNKPIYCHCGSGRRVLVVSKLLRAQGYDIRPLDSGYDELLKAGFEKATEKEDKQE